jgi:hypothetical protein
LKSDEDVMNYYRRLMIILMAVFLYAGCSKNGEEKSKDIISGNSSKTWKEVKEINPEGSKKRLTKDEKNEVIQFYSDGHFIMKSSNASNEGTWRYEKSGQNLSLTFGGANFTEYFTVLELEKSKMKLKGRDGAILVMKAWKG